MRVLPAKIKKMKHQPVQGRSRQGAGGRVDVLKQQKPKVRENICADSAKRKERERERGEKEPIDGVKVWRGQ